MKKTKSKLLQLSVGISASVLALSPLSIAVIQNTANRNIKAVTNNNISSNATYKPLLMHEECLNSNVIINKPSSTSDLGGWGECMGVDKMSAINNKELIESSGESSITSCNWFTTNASTTGTPMTLNEDNTVTVTSSETTDLSWTIQNVGLYDENNNPKNNAIRVWGEDGHKTSNIVLNNSECGSTLYLLATAANSKSSASELKVTINYTTGDPVSTNFTIMDWGATPTGTAAKVAHKFSRMLGDGKNGAIEHLYVDESQTYNFCQCELTLDDTRIVKSLDLTWNAELNPSMVFTVYGISCAVRDIVVPSAPTCSTKGKVDATLNWTNESSCVVVKYSLDIATDANFTNILDNYNNKTIDKPSGDTVTFTTDSDLVPNTTYYARIRSVNADSQQSAASSTLSFTTNEVNVSSVKLNGFKTEALYGDTFDFTTEVVGETIGGTKYNPKNQKVTHSTVDGLTITDNPDDDTKHTCQCTKCISKPVSFKSELDTSKGISPTITVRPHQVTNINFPSEKIQDNSFDVAWDKVTEAEKYFVTISKNADLSNPVAGWDKKALTETSSTAVGLTAGTTYYVGIYAVNNGILSKISDIASVKTTGTAPDEGDTNNKKGLWIGLGVGGGLIATGLGIGLPIGLVYKRKKDKDKKKK